MKYFLHRSSSTLWFLLFSIASTLAMRTHELSDDQLNYVAIADMILNPSTQVLWVPYRTFAFILAGLFNLTADHIYSIRLIYFAIAFLYLIAMNWSLKQFVSDRKTCLIISFASIIPHYTMGMTFWGFAGSSFILPRILFMPIAPIALTLLLKKPGKPIWYIIPAICATAGILSFESFLLTAICFPVMFMILLNKKSCLRNYAYLTISFIMTTGIIFFILFFPKTYEPDFFAVLKPVYNSIMEPLHPALSALSPLEFAALHWEAAYAACWWTLFPPRLSDVAFTIFDCGPLLIAASVGFFISGKYEKLSRKYLFFILITVILCAYGYQTIRFSLWKLSGAHPHIWEEVRSFKFSFFPLFVLSAFALQKSFKNEKKVAQLLLIVCLFTPPLFLLRSIPYKFKQNIIIAAEHILQKPEYVGYVKKAVKFPDYDRLAEIEKLNNLIRDLSGNLKVMSNLHHLKQSGKTVVIAYNDKRVDVINYNGQELPKLPYWMIAYEQVSEAVTSGNASLFISTMKKFGCRLGVSEKPLNSEKLSTIMSGRFYHLYRLTD